METHQRFAIIHVKFLKKIHELKHSISISHCSTKKNRNGVNHHRHLHICCLVVVTRGKSESLCIGILRQREQGPRRDSAFETFLNLSHTPAQVDLLETCRGPGMPTAAIERSLQRQTRPAPKNWRLTSEDQSSAYVHFWLLSHGTNPTKTLRKHRQLRERFGLFLARQWCW